MQLISFCTSRFLPVNYKIVSWSSTNLRLEIVSKVELWNFLSLPFNSNFHDEPHVIPNIAVIIVHEEVADLVVEVLLLEHNEVLPAEIE